MNPQMALAQVVVDELVRAGVREVVLAPGSRSAPLAYALHEADAAGRLRLHVRIDERSAAFLSLGLAKATGVPAPVVTTSGTAVANLMPAVLEAHESGVPLILLTADRPPELRGTRANQTTDQLHVFSGFVRWFHDLGVPEPRVGAQAAWRTSIDRAVAAATGATSGDAGPVHLNLPLRDPLAPHASSDAEGTWPEPLTGRPDGGPWTRVARSARAVWAVEAQSHASPNTDELALPLVPRTLVVLGDAPRDLIEAAVVWARSRRHPVIGEPFGRWGDGGPERTRLPHGVRLASRAGEERLRPERIVVVGRLTLSRSLGALLRLPGVRVDLVCADERWPDPGHVVHEVHRPDVLARGPECSPGSAPEGASAATEFRQAWRAAAYEASAQVEADVAWPSGAAVAATLMSALPGEAVLFLGSSSGVRHVDLVRGGSQADSAEVVANRGLAGIDGCMSTASGLALASDRPTYAFLGDLTFLHDANGLIVGPGEPRVDLTVVVANDDGGAIFGDLEYGRPAQREAYPGVLERVFLTPTGTDLASLCRAHGARHVLATTPERLRDTVSVPPHGITVIEVPLPSR